jgi:hypothetical protein
MNQNQPDPGSLAAWMVDANPEHPLHRPGIRIEIIVALDEIIRSLELVQPLRLGQKRKAFQQIKALDQLSEQRAELLAASLLARAGVGFEFANDHPDLVLHGGTSGIEVGSRTVDSTPWDIHEKLELRLSDQQGLLIVLTFDDRPLKLGVEQVAQIVDRIVEKAIDNPTTGLRFEGAKLSVGFSPDSGFEGCQVMLNFGNQIGALLTDHLAEVDREVDNVIVKKRRQAQKIPTVLLVDVSRLGEGWIRNGSVWVSVLRAKLKNEPFVGLGVMVSTVDSSLPLHLHVALGSAAPLEMHQALEQVAELFNLAIEP